MLIQKMVWKLIRITMKLIIYVGQRLWKNMVLHRHVKADFHSVQNVARSIFSERFLLKCVKSTTANEIRSA